MRDEVRHVQLWTGEMGYWEVVQQVPEKEEMLHVWLEVCHSPQPVGRSARHTAELAKSS